MGCMAHELLDTQPVALLCNWEAHVRENGTWTGELERTTAQGEKIAIEARWQLRRDRSGRPIEIVETSRDAGVARTATETARRSEYRYTNLFNAMAVSFWELDFSEVGEMLARLRQAGVDDLASYFEANREFVRSMIRSTRVVDVNEQTVNLFGPGRKHKLLKTLEPFWPEASIGVFAESVVAAAAKTPHYVAETRFRTLDGREFDALFTACFPPEMLLRAKIVVGIIDISGTKKARLALEASETRYRNLFHFVPIPLIRLDRTELATIFETLKAQGIDDLGRHIDTHPAFTKMAMDSIKVVETNYQAVQLLGANDADALLGPVTRIWSESPEVFQRSMKARFSGEARFESEMNIRTFDGRLLNALYVTDFPEALANPALGLACLIDITDRVKAQEMLQRLQSDFAHAARISMLGELTASIAHEINQPLTSITTAGEAALTWMNRPQPELSETRELTARIVSEGSTSCRDHRACPIDGHPNTARSPAPPS